MTLEKRIDLLATLGDYMRSDANEWLEARRKASELNPWFIEEFIELSAANIANQFLQRSILQKWADEYKLGDNDHPKSIGIVMAGNIPMVGFHDLLSVFITGNRSIIKLSSKDTVLIRHLVEVLKSLDEQVNDYIAFSETLKNCDAYIATGSNNTSRYFEYYFGKHPHIIRKNKTSVAVLKGDESPADLEKLADDVYTYFGLGCRNVTKIYVPQEYDFLPLLESFKKYNHLADHYRYKNNYDYNLALLILNKKYYMNNGSIILTEDNSLFSPISQLNYEYYTNETALEEKLSHHPDIQGITGKNFIPFGSAQCPTVLNYADNVDTVAFLRSL